MGGTARGVLADLFAAAEAVADKDGVWGGGADGGEKDALGEGLRDGELVAFEAEGTGHTTAAGVQMIDLGTGGLEEGDLPLHGHESFLMAVAVDDNAAAGKLGWVPGCAEPGKVLAQHDGLVAKAVGAVVVREEVGEFVLEDAGAAGLEHDNGDAGADLWLEVVEDAEEIAAGVIEEAEVVEGATAAEMAARDLNLASGCR